MNFEVKISQIWIKSHPNADSLELGNIGSLKYNSKLIVK